MYLLSSWIKASQEAYAGTKDELVQHFDGDELLGGSRALIC